MKILIACEYSGAVRDAFVALGHDAMSCDLLPTDVEGPHYQGDVADIINDGWDMMIGFPPCQHLAVSGARWFKQKRLDGRQQQGIDFFMSLASASIPKIAIENPIGIMSTKYRKPNQIIQPWQFGHEATKSTCLWLKGLPLLKPTQVVGKGERHVTKSGRSLPKWYNLPPSENRWKIRSKTFQGIATAMSQQWGNQ
jgi:site-specific DNA-cytosine methylase